MSKSKTTKAPESAAKASEEAKAAGPSRTHLKHMGAHLINLGGYLTTVGRQCYDGEPLDVSALVTRLKNHLSECGFDKGRIIAKE